MFQYHWWIVPSLFLGASLGCFIRKPVDMGYGTGLFEIIFFFCCITVAITLVVGHFL